MVIKLRRRGNPRKIKEGSESRSCSKTLGRSRCRIQSEGQYIAVEDDHWGGKGADHGNPDLVDDDGGGEGGDLQGEGEGGDDHGGEGGLREGGRAPGVRRVRQEDPRQVPFKGEQLLKHECCYQVRQIALEQDILIRK